MFTMLFGAVSRPMPAQATRDWQATVLFIGALLAIAGIVWLIISISERRLVSKTQSIVLELVRSTAKGEELKPLNIFMENRTRFGDGVGTEHVAKALANLAESGEVYLVHEAQLVYKVK